MLNRAKAGDNISQFYRPLERHVFPTLKETIKLNLISYHSQYNRIFIIDYDYYDHRDINFARENKWAVFLGRIHGRSTRLPH